jgi:hypothetical protein
MWARVTFMPTRHINPRTEKQIIQRCQCSEFARNGTGELIFNCSNKMVRKCEQAWHSCQQDTSIHVLRSSRVNDVRSRRPLGMEPVRSLDPVQIEWQGSEQAWHSCQQDTPIHVPSDRLINEVSSPSSLGMEPVSWLVSVQIEWWQGNVSKRDIHANKTRQSTYGATV